MEPILSPAWLATTCAAVKRTAAQVHYLPIVRLAQLWHPFAPLRAAALICRNAGTCKIDGSSTGNPTMREAGVPGETALSWQGIFDPAKLPQDIVRGLARER